MVHYPTNINYESHSGQTEEHSRASDSFAILVFLLKVGRDAMVLKALTKCHLLNIFSAISSGNFIFPKPSKIRNIQGRCQPTTKKTWAGISLASSPEEPGCCFAFCQSSKMNTILGCFIDYSYSLPASFMDYRQGLLFYSS